MRKRSTNRAMTDTKNEAVLFAEWLYNNRWYSFNAERGEWSRTHEHPTVIGEKTYKKHFVRTTEQLYLIFRAEKTYDYTQIS